MVEKKNKFIKILILLASITLCLIVLIPKISESKEKEDKNVISKEDPLVTAAKNYVKNNREYFNEFFKEKDMSYKLDITVLEKEKLYENKENKKGYVSIVDDKYYNIISLDKADYLINKIIDKENGVNNENSPFDLKYIYKGEEVKNYFKYSDRMFRIIGITNSNHLKLIEVEENSDIKSYGLGENIDWFKESDGENFKNDLAYNSDKGIFYVGFVRSNVTVKNEIIKNEKRNNEYTVKQPKYYGKYALINISDIINASSECNFTSIIDVSKDNCNSYLLDLVKNSYTLTTGEDNKVYIVDEESKITLTNTLDNIKAHNVIYLNGLSNFEGEGTSDNPYVLTD